MVLCDWLPSLSIMTSGLICVISHVRISCIAESCSTIQMCCILLPYSLNGLHFRWLLRVMLKWVFVHKCLCGYIFNVLHLCVSVMCVCLHVCECDVCMWVWRSKFDVGCFPRSLCTSLIEERSPTWVSLAIRPVPELCCVCLPSRVLGSQMATTPARLLCGF